MRFSFSHKYSFSARTGKNVAHFIQLFPTNFLCVVLSEALMLLLKYNFLIAPNITDCDYVNEWISPSPSLPLSVFVSSRTLWVCVTDKEEFINYSSVVGAKWVSEGSGKRRFVLTRRVVTGKADLIRYASLLLEKKLLKGKNETQGIKAAAAHIMTPRALK